MLRLGGFFVLLFGAAALFLLVEGLMYGITGQVVSSLMLLSATIFTEFHRPARAAERARRRGVRLPSLAV